MLLYRFKLFALTAIFVLTVSASSQKESVKAIKKITPLLSTREDVLEAMGKPVDDPKHSSSWFYNFKDGRVNIIFEDGNCVWQSGTQTWSGWKVSEGTAVSVSLWFSVPVKPSKIGVDLSRLTKVKIGGDPSSYEYSDAKNGLIYNVNNGKILDIDRVPREDQLPLKCSSKSPEGLDY
jgi:hypothetical protein